MMSKGQKSFAVATPLTLFEAQSQKKLPQLPSHPGNRPDVELFRTVTLNRFPRMGYQQRQYPQTFSYGRNCRLSAKMPASIAPLESPASRQHLAGFRAKRWSDIYGHWCQSRYKIPK
jgi:hypothetical protein